AFACTSITEERVTKSYDLLLTTRLTPFEIVLGKTAASFIYGLLLIVAASPLVAITFLYGGVTPEQIALTFVCLVVEAALITAYAIYISSVSASTLKSVISSYLGVCLLGPVLLAPIVFMAVVHVIGPLLKETKPIQTRDAIRAFDLP